MSVLSLPILQYILIGTSGTVAERYLCIQDEVFKHVHPFVFYYYCHTAFVR